MELNGEKINAGAKAIVKINVGRLPSGNQINLNTFVYRGKKSGPTLLVLAGVHGDEINGVEIVRRAIAGGIFERLTRGNVIAIPVLNIFGFINFSRDVPDGKDVNRSFPGESSGSLASRVAFTFSKKILPLIDFGVDFHTGGRSLYNFPQVRFSKGHPQSLEMAKNFGAPFSLASKPIAKSLRKTGIEQNKPIIVFEGGESLRLDGLAIQKGLEGLQNLLYKNEMADKISEPKTTAVFENTSWERAPRSGIFVWSKSSGTPVKKGEPLGFIGDPYGQEKIMIRAKKDGYIVGHNNAPVVSQGDALFHIAY
ncbi:MAG TPA: succinylglutamate desuccinylase/aspartoacylase family protein [Saprospiraceae bacterium]|nr:succinylglutamate desuccinylase/aspartoacylase family protein [Saprospiraceae bacterium]